MIRALLEEHGPEAVIVKLVKLAAQLKEEHDYVSTAFIGMATANGLLIDGLNELDCEFGLLGVVGQELCDGDLCPRCHALIGARAVLEEFSLDAEEVPVAEA